MGKTTTVRIYEEDKERIAQMADAKGVKPSEVVAELLREPAYVCPECGDPFAPDEIDPETVEEHGLMTTDVGRLVRGERQVKSFECPCCEARLQPSDVDMADASYRDAAGYEELGVPERNEGVTPEGSEGGTSEEEA